MGAYILVMQMLSLEPIILKTVVMEWRVATEEMSSNCELSHKVMICPAEPMAELAM